MSAGAGTSDKQVWVVEKQVRRAWLPIDCRVDETCAQLRAQELRRTCPQEKFRTTGYRRQK